MPVINQLKEREMTAFLGIAPCLKQLNEDGFMWTHLQSAQSHGTKSVHPRTGNKHSLWGQARRPLGVQGVTCWSYVEQHQEVDTTPGA